MGKKGKKRFFFFFKFQRYTMKFNSVKTIVVKWNRKFQQYIPRAWGVEKNKKRERVNSAETTRFGELI